MNARTDFPTVADAQAPSARQGLSRLLVLWRGRLKTWRRPHRLMLTATVERMAQETAMTAAIQAFEAWAEQNGGAVVELCLSSHWLLMLADDGAAQIGGVVALRERAVERWTHYLDLPIEGFDTEWLVQTSLDQGRSPVALACAVPRSFRDKLLMLARRHGVKLLSIQPWWAGGLQQAWQGLPPPSQVLGSVLDEQPAASGQGEALRHWTWREGAWQTQACVAAEPGRWVLSSLAFVTDAGALDQADPIAMPNEVFDAPASAAVEPMALPPSAWPPFFSMKSPSEWVESLNFAGPRVRTSFWSWALLALGAIAVVHALDLARQVDEAQEAVQVELSRLQAHVQPASHPRAHEAVSGQRASTVHPAAGMASASPPAASASSPAGPAPALQPDAWRSAAQLAAWLGNPWSAALDHADATAHQRGISLMRFQLDLATWGARAEQPLTWRLQAAVPDDAAALAWVQDLGPQAELQRRDALAQPVSSERGTLAWRIDVSVSGGQP